VRWATLGISIRRLIRACSIGRPKRYGVVTLDPQVPEIPAVAWIAAPNEIIWYFTPQAAA